MDLPVAITIITYAPTTFYHCQHCELTFQEVGLGERLRREEAAAALPDDLAREFAELSDWVRAVVQRHGPRVHLDVLDAVSIRGVLASVRHGIFRYPAVIVDGQAMTLRRPDEFGRADDAIARRLSAVAA
jgi:hypothetical protein